LFWRREIQGFLLISINDLNSLREISIGIDPERRIRGFIVRADHSTKQAHWWRMIYFQSKCIELAIQKDMRVEIAEI